MRVRIIAAGTRLPEWVNQGFAEYAKRLPRSTPLELTEIPLKAAGDAARVRRAQGERMLKHLSPGLYVTALEVQGESRSSEELARWLAARLRDGRELAFLIGGPDGLDAACLERAQERLSLSPLTLPHGLVRVLLAEQLYRATTLLAGHPYHRG